MRKSFLFVTLLAFIFIYTDSIGQPEDQGMTSAVHTANAGKIVFSNDVIDFQKEDVSKFKDKFNWQESLHFRVYLKEGLGKVYHSLGWEGNKTYYYFEVRANGKLISYMTKALDPSWTTYRGCFFPASGDPQKYIETSMLWDGLSEMKAGDNLIKVNFYARNGLGGEASEILCSGEFTLNVPQEQIDWANKFTFQKIKTRWSGDDAWKEWNISLVDKAGVLKTRWAGDDAWKEWNYTIWGISGSIKTRWSGDDAWKEWELHGKGGQVRIKTRWSGSDAWKEWEVIGKSTLKVKTRWSGSDAWKEWEISGPKGTMKVKTRWSGDDAWKEWEITDNMPGEDMEIKLAAIFPCIYSGTFFR